MPRGNDPEGPQGTAPPENPEATPVPSELSTSPAAPEEDDDDDGDSPGLTFSRLVSTLIIRALVAVTVDKTSRPNSRINIESPPASSRSLMESDPAPTVPPGVTNDRRETPHVSRRKPVYSLAFVTTAQLQFLAMLSLVDHVSEGSSSLADFVVGLRWINLWWEPEFAENVITDRCSTTSGNNAIGPPVFIGNLFLVCSILMGLFLLHDRARGNVSAARGSGMSMGELRNRLLDGGGPFSEGIYLPAWRSSRRSLLNEEEKSDEEGEQEEPVVTNKALRPVTVCRDKSHSVWLHYPHVELFVLFFAFDGAVSSQLTAIQAASDCDEVFYLACLSLLLYPLLIFMVVWRAIVVRVLPDILLVFERYETGISDRRGFFNRIRSRTHLSYSMFSWAYKGQWETVTTSGNVETIRNGDWFRIGFEPVFVDYTKEGTWYILIYFVQGAAIACIGVLINDSVIQLFLFCGIDFIMLAILLLKRPFANSVINAVEAFLMMLDVVSTALLGVSVLQWKGMSRQADVNSAVLIIQLAALILLFVPVYLDLSIIVLGAILKKWRQFVSSQMTSANEREEEREARKYVRSHIRRKCCYAWCAMLRHNVVACARDISNGLRKANVPGDTNEERARSPSV